MFSSRGPLDLAQKPRCEFPPPEKSAQEGDLTPIRDFSGLMITVTLNGFSMPIRVERAKTYFPIDRPVFTKRLVSSVLDQQTTESA